MGKHIFKKIISACIVLISSYPAASVTCNYPSITPYRDAIYGAENSLLMDTLKHARGNIVRASRCLGLNKPTLERKIAMHSIEVSDFMSFPNERCILYRTVIDKIEYPLLRNSMKVTNGNKGEASACLGINRATLQSKLKTHGLLNYPFIIGDWKADIRIEKISAKAEGPDGYSCTINIKNSNDDDALDSKLVILIAPEVRANINDFTYENNYNGVSDLALAQNIPDISRKDAMIEKIQRETNKNYANEISCLSNKVTGASSPYHKQNSYILCNLGNLSTLTNFSIKATGTIVGRISGFKPICSATVFSSSPDINQSNNFKSSK